MSTDLHQAIEEFKASELTELLVAALANRTAAAAPAHSAGGCGCHHQAAPPAPAPAPRGSVGRPLAIGAGIVVGGCVLTGLFLAVALTAVAVALSGVVLLILVRELRKGGAR
jgi:hypothetical protein